MKSKIVNWRIFFVCLVATAALAGGIYWLSGISFWVAWGSVILGWGVLGVSTLFNESDESPSDASQAKTADEELESLYRFVGLVVIQWGQSEQSLDLVVSTLYQNYGGSALVKKMPKMLETKLEFVEKAFEELKGLDEFKPLAMRVVSEFKRLREFRHDFIHGAIADTVPKNGRFSFVKLDVGRDIHSVREFEIDGRDIPAITEDLVNLGGNTVRLARLIWDKSVGGG